MNEIMDENEDNEEKIPLISFFIHLSTLQNLTKKKLYTSCHLRIWIVNE
jgi:hypothetical protein